MDVEQGESPTQFNQEPDAGSTGVIIGVIAQEIANMDFSDLKNLAPIIVGVLGPLGAKYGFDASTLVQALIGFGAVGVGIYNHFVNVKPALVAAK